MSGRKKILPYIGIDGTFYKDTVAQNAFSIFKFKQQAKKQESNRRDFLDFLATDLISECINHRIQNSSSNSYSGMDSSLIYSFTSLEVSIIRKLVKTRRL